MNTRIILFFVGLFWALNAGAQIFPVQLQQQFGSLPSRLADFSSDPLSQYQLSLQLLDPDETEVQVQLRLRIEGPNLRITTRAGVAPVLHQLSFGLPLTLNGGELNYLFAPANLRVEGLDAAGFWQSGGLLPEGFYNVCVEAFLPARASELGVSGEHCVPLFVNVAEPPIITYPIANQAIPALTPANLAITWQDQGPGGLVNYDLEVTPYGNPPGLMELDGGPRLPVSNDGFGAIRQNLTPLNLSGNGNFFPSGNGLIGPATVVNANAPLIFRSGLNGLSYQLQPDDPALRAGGQYLVRVRAYDPLGEQVFRNGGWSQPVLFTYGETCPAPVNVNATPVSDLEVRLSWSDAGIPPNGYTLRFRSLTAARGNWTEVSTTVPTYLIDQLQPNTAYSYELSAVCGGLPGNIAAGIFTTPGIPNTGTDPDGTVATTPTTTAFAADGDGGTPYQPQVADCSPDATLASLATGPTDPNKKVLINETFRFYDLDIRPVRVSGGTVFSGEGTLLIPWLNQGAVAVQFSGITLNANGEAVQGTVSPMRKDGAQGRIDLSQFRASLGVQESCANYTETVLDARGFNDAGIHYLTGTELDPYDFDRDGNYQGQDGQLTDPRGFNADGQHANGTDYDDNGCNRDSLNQYGQPCTWRQHGNANGNQNTSEAGNTAATTVNGSGGELIDDGIVAGGEVNPGAATVDGTTYLGTISDDSLRSLMLVAIDTMLARIDFRIQGYGGLRSLLSTSLDYYLNLTGLDRGLLVGPNDELLQPGMSALFPNGIPPADSLDRELDYWLYDKAIRGLYRLDKHTVDTLQPLRALYESHQSSPRDGQLLDHLKRHVRALNASDIAKLGSTTAILEWVRRRVSIQLTTLFSNPAAGYSEWYNPSLDFAAGPKGPVLAGDLAGWQVLAPVEADIPALLRSLRVTSYDPLLGFKLPLKIEREVAGQTFTIYIDDLKFSTAGIQVDAFCILPIPGKDGQFVAFKGENIPLTRGGFQGMQRLSLVSQLDIGLGTYGTMTFPTNSQTYVEFSCDGYEGFSLDGQVLFCRDKLIPVDPNGKLMDAPNRVTADFRLQGTSWPNFLLKLETDKRFAVKGLRDIYWLGDDIWIDFSEEASPDVTFPADYQHAFVGTDRKPAEQWRGVHVKTLDVTIDVLAKRQDGSELGFTARDMIIDDTGLSIKATARNLLTKEEGRIGKWQIGVDTVFLHLSQSAFKAARITGDLVLPTDDADEVRFTGQASDGGDYAFSATLQKDKRLKWDMWDGEITLATNTSFEILRSAQSGWDVRARLYGQMKLGIEPNAKFTVPDIVFEDFRLASFKPYVDLGPGGRFGIEGAAVNLGGFGIEVSKLALVRPQGSSDQFGVDVAGKISFMGGSGGFGASAGVTVFGDVREVPDGLTFNYDRLKVNDIFLATKIPGVMINGGVRFFDREEHPTYGDGFQGLIDARFDGVGLGLKAAGQFGSMEDYRYWFVDAAALLQIGVSSIPLVGVVHLTGIGGGASYHMTRSDDNAAGQNVDFTQVSTSLPPIGTSITNINYVPDRNTGLGLRLMAAIATFPTASVMNGAIILGAEFTPSWGINKINLDGSAAFMTIPAAPGSSQPPEPTIAAGLNIAYLHRQRELNGSLRGYLNYGGVVVGGLKDASGTPNYIGQIDFLATPGRWKLWMGTPSQPLSVKFKPLDLTVGTYLDIGSTLPTFPNLPQEFRGLGLTDLSVPAGARGFMHGFDASIPTGNKPKRFDAWRIRAEIRARFGYNMMLTNSIACEGRDNFGIGGWFLQGNAYAGFYGAIKFGTALSGDKFSSTVNLASLDAKAVVQLRGPNPTFFEGAANIDYDVLGWTGSHRVNFAFGNTCNIVDVPPPAIETQLYLPFQGLIAYSQPAAGETDVDVTSEPRIVTVEDIGKVVMVPHGDRTRRFRIAARESDQQLKNLRTNQTVPAYVGIGDGIRINPNGTLAPNEQYELSVRVYLEEEVNGNWVTFLLESNPYEHRQVIQFTTGNLPDLALITETLPTQGSLDVDIFTKPSFKLSLSKLRNLDYFFGGGWELSIVEASLLANDVKMPEDFIPGNGYYDRNDYRWSGEGALQPQTDHQLRLRVRAKRSRYGQVEWLEVGGLPYEESVTVNFRTGARRETIADGDISHAYPERFQYNTYRDLRSGNCFLKLTQSLTEILGPDWLDATENKLIVQYLDNVTKSVVATADVVVGTDLLEWPALPTELDLDRTFELRFVISSLRPEASATTMTSTSVNGQEVNITPATPAGGIAAGKVIYQYWFRTSVFTTWKAKVAGLNLEAPTAIERRGINSPRIWNQDVPWPNFMNDSIPYPYVEDLSQRGLGTDVYRRAMAPGELLSADELDEEGISIALKYKDEGYVRNLRENYFNWSRTTTAVTCDGEGNVSTSVPVTWSDELPDNTLSFRQNVQGPSLESSSGHGLASQPGPGGMLAGASNLFGGLLNGQTSYPTVAEMEADRTLMPGYDLQPMPPVSGRIVLFSELSSRATVRYNQSWAYRRSFQLRPAGACNPEDLVNNTVNPDELDQQLNPGDIMSEIDLINNAVLAGQLQQQFGGGTLNTGNGTPQPGNGGVGPTYNANVNATMGGTMTTVQINAGQGVTEYQQGSINGQMNNGYGTQGGGVSSQLGNGNPVPGGGFRLRPEIPWWLRRTVTPATPSEFMPYPLPEARGQLLRAVMEYRIVGPGGKLEIFYSDPIDLTIP